MLSRSEDHPGRSLAFVIFGGTGDLTHRKLLPALYNLMTEQLLPADYIVYCIGRREKNDSIYRAEAAESIRKHSRSSIDVSCLNSFLNHVHYHRLEFRRDETGYDSLYNRLNTELTDFEKPVAKLFFLAVAPEYFSVVIAHLHAHKLIEKGNPDHRVMVEKPFGSDLASARELNDGIIEVLAESQIFRIDHYLGKEMIQNIMAIRFGNSLFEPLWNHYYIDNIQITSTEKLGVESRGGYYEQVGILKDMLQNHLLQMLAIIAMEPPVDLSAESVRDEKVKVLRTLRFINSDLAGSGIIAGQYAAGNIDGRPVLPYRAEENVDFESNTLTYVALKAAIDNFRWGGVPIYIRAGKRLDRQRTQIVIEFKRLPGISFYEEFKTQSPNLLVIEVQPAEGMYFQINSKRPGNEFAMERIELNYCQNCRFQGNVPEAYERLILEAFRGNSSLFTRWDELEHSWTFIEGIEKLLLEKPVTLPNYAAGSRGPETADELIEADGRHWWEIDIDNGIS